MGNECCCAAQDRNEGSRCCGSRRPHSGTRVCTCSSPSVAEDRISAGMVGLMWPRKGGTLLREHDLCVWCKGSDGVALIQLCVGGGSWGVGSMLGEAYMLDDHDVK